MSGGDELKHLVDRAAPARTLKYARRLAVTCALVLASAGRAQTSAHPAALYAAPSPDEVFLQLAARISEPRGFCLDFPGFPASGDVTQYRESSWPVAVHTCKTGIERANVATIDQLFSASALRADGQLRFSRLNVCVEALTFRGANVPGHQTEAGIRQDAPLVAKPCADVAEQHFAIDAAGRIHPALDATKCLTVGVQAFEAGDRAPGQHWYRRDLQLSRCTPGAARYQLWRIAPAPALPTP
jgi:hypothetical protein